MNAVSLVLAGSPERRGRLKRQLHGRRDIRVDGEVGETHAARLIPEIDPDVVVLDCAAPVINGIVVLQWLRALPRSPRILALGATGKPAERRLLLGLGADAYALLEAPATITQALAALSAPDPTAPVRARAA